MRRVGSAGTWVRSGRSRLNSVFSGIFSWGSSSATSAMSTAGGRAEATSAMLPVRLSFFFSNPPLLHPGPSPRVLAFAGDPRFDRRPDRLRARSTSASGRGFPKHSGAGTGRRSTLWGGRSLIGQKMDAKRSL